MTAQMRVAVMMNGVSVENQQILMKNSDSVSSSHHPSKTSCYIISSAELTLYPSLLCILCFPVPLFSFDTCIF